MGLDSYLERMPRYGNTTPHEISAIESYFDWKGNPAAKKYTMKEWCGIPFKDVPKGKTMEFYKKHYKYGRLYKESNFQIKLKQQLNKSIVADIALEKRLDIGERQTKSITGLLKMCKMELMTANITKK